MKRTPVLTVLTMLCVLMLVGSSFALLLNLSKEDLISNSSVIVMGKVKEVNCAWSQDRNQIYTYVTLQVQDQFKGASVEENYVIQIPGGKVGDVTLRVEDTPTLLPGQEIIVHTFLQDTGYPWIYGWESGVLFVDHGNIPAYDMTVHQFRILVESLEQ